MKFEGRNFTEEEIKLLKNLIKKEGVKGRSAISRIFCKEISWVKLDGTVKDMSCRKALLKMEKAGLIKLPERKGRNNNNPLNRAKRTLFGEKGEEKYFEIEGFSITLEEAKKGFETDLWNELIDRYHYLGHKALPGSQIKYFVKNGKEIYAALSFSASAWMIKPRDLFIGWDHETRQKNLHLVINNSRFLILPWIHCKNLATKILSMAVKRVASDFEERYKYRPVLLETFVDKKLFKGTCYKAGNWIHVGETTGRGKLGQVNKPDKVIKDIYLYPLKKNFRKELCQLS